MKRAAHVATKRAAQIAHAAQATRVARARHATRLSRARHAAPGQSLVEFALVLPAFVLVSLLCLQLGVLGVRWFQLVGVASTAARYAATYNGETSQVDGAIVRIAGASGFQPDRLWVEIDTGAAPEQVQQGHLHRSDQAQTSDAPPPAGYNGDVTIHLTYQLPLLFNLFGATIPVGTSLSQESTGAYGGLAP